MSDFRRFLRIDLAVGLALSAALIGGFTGCGSKLQEPTAQTKKFRPADEGEAQSAPAASPFEPADQIATGSTTLPPTNLTAEFAATNSPPVADAKPARRGSPSTSEPPGPKGDTSQAASPQVQQLVDQLNRLGEQQPRGSTQQEQLEDFVRNQQQRLAIGKKILSLNPASEIKQQVARAMYEVYMVFGRVGVPSARQQMMDFAKSLAADSDSKLARLGRHMTFDANVSRMATEGVGDGQAIVAEVQTLLDAEKGELTEPTLQLAGQAAEILLQTGFKNEAVATYELMAKSAAADPKMAAQATRFADTAKLAKADLTTLLSDLIKTGQKDAEQKLMSAVSGLIKELGPSRELFGNMQQVAQILESTGYLESARQCYAELDRAFKESTDKEVAEAAAQMSAGAIKRLSLVGKPLEVEGLTPDGKPFDWSAYKGKVVLLDFWATWCQPCLEELPNIQRNFEQFHAKGFEVVGVNLNTKLGDLKEFLTLQELPWPTVVSQVVIDGNAGRDWSQLPMANKCGVDAIPFVVLIGKDGNVDSIHVRGPKLKNRLTQLLGEPITTEIPADPTQPTPPGPAPRTGAKPPAGKQSRALPVGAATPLAFLLTQALLTADPPAADDETAVNPYKAKPGLTPSQLVAYIQKMLDRPQVIQTRPGFAEAVVDACDRIVAAGEATASEQLGAVQTKFAVLHRAACDGKEAADKQLSAFAEQLKDDAREPIAHEAEFFRLERRVLDAKDLPLEEIPDLLKDVKSYLTKDNLTAKHLRLASGTVAAINRLENGDERELLFGIFGELFGKSNDKELARYGKKIAKKSAKDEGPLTP